MKISPETQGYCTIRHRPERNAPETQVVDYLERVAPPGNSYITWTARDVWSDTPLDELQYSWRLNKSAWSGFSHETSHTFLNLTSGRYVLEVRARDRAFNVDPTPARVEFVVIPPVWQQVWFISLISSLLGLIAFFLWRWVLVREQRLCEQQEQREAFLIRQQAEQEAELRGELISYQKMLNELEEQLRQTRAPFIECEEKDDEDREFLDRIMKVLEEHYSDWEFGREDLAIAFKMSLSSFQRKLKTVSRHTPKQLIREFRLSRAA